MKTSGREKTGQKIVPFLWFDDQAEEAANFYTSIFKKSKIGKITRYGKAGYEIHHREAGTVMTVDFEIEGQKFTALNGGPLFKFNPSISFFVNFDPSRDKNARKNLDTLWEKLSQGGTALMPLDKYPFSEHYGWVQDKYGLSWQLILTNPEGEERPFIIPSILFVGTVCGKAEEAVDFYMSVFKNSKCGVTVRYAKGMEPDKEGTIMFSDFMIESQWFAAMDSAYEHKFSFNEAISFVVDCNDQKEVDYYWGKLSAVPQAEQCGWLKDKYGVSWQVVPTVLSQMMQDKDPKKSERVMEALLPMKEIDIEKLKQVYERE